MRFPGINCRTLASGLLLVLAVTGLAQAKSDLQPTPTIPPEEGRRLARELLVNLLKLKPSENVEQKLLVKVTDPDDNTTEVPVIFSVVVTPTNFLNIYETVGSSNAAMKLTVVHAKGRNNEYRLSQPPNAPPRTLATNELTTSFAGSDFWVSDLGLEFLHWPQARVTKKQMRKNLFCEVLESTNPQPGPGEYSKVVSWIAANRPDDIVIVHADAYDATGKLLKQFDPKKIRKVNGAWELAEMEIRNRQTRSNTRIAFEAQSTEESN